MQIRFASTIWFCTEVDKISPICQRCASQVDPEVEDARQEADLGAEALLFPQKLFSLKKVSIFGYLNY